MIKNTVDSGVGPNPSQLINSERKPEFPIDKIFHSLEGAKSQKVLEIYSQLERDPILSSKFSEYGADLKTERELTTLRIERLTKYLELESIEDFFLRLNLITVYDPSLGIRISVNLGLFLNCIKGNGTEGQVKYWAYTKEAEKLKQIYGCFAMTELGHGSNVAGCETTATFDKETDEFVVNTPHIGATKWWIGGAAHSATHSVVYARLIVKGKDYGVKTFIVPLRDSKHNLLAGISIGDIGAKMGRSGVDNGWIQYSNVKIPRHFMLQKWCKVDRDGTVTLPPLEQLSYISLLGGRVYMAVDSYRICARFITIAIRYAVGRRQFKQGKNQLETQLLDYPLHQRRLLPLLALTYAMGFGTNLLEAQHKSCSEKLNEAVRLNDKAKIMEGLQDTKSLFNDSGSLKSTCTWLAADCIDQCRQACGGHGYSAYNGFGKSYDDWVVQCTWEGDNNVLSMSCGKTVISNVEAVLKGKKVVGTMDFLNNVQPTKLTTINDLTPQSTLKALEYLIKSIAEDCIEQLKTQTLDDISYLRVLLSKLRCHHYLLRSFPDIEELKPVLKVYYLTQILESFATDFIQYGILTPGLKSQISLKVVPEMLRTFRPLAIPLTDSFKQPDNLLHSAIGKYNGDIYENYFDIVKSENPPFDTKAKYSSLLEGMLNRN